MKVEILEGETISTSPVADVQSNKETEDPTSPLPLPETLDLRQRSLCSNFNGFELENHGLTFDSYAALFLPFLSVCERLETESTQHTTDKKRR